MNEAQIDQYLEKQGIKIPTNPCIPEPDIVNNFMDMAEASLEEIQRGFDIGDASLTATGIVGMMHLGALMARVSGLPLDKLIREAHSTIMEIE